MASSIYCSYESIEKVVKLPSRPVIRKSFLRLPASMILHVTQPAAKAPIILTMKEPVKNGSPAYDEKREIESLSTAPIIAPAAMYKYRFNGSPPPASRFIYANL